jgi:hypothetical protein
MSLYSPLVIGPAAFGAIGLGLAWAAPARTSIAFFAGAAAAGLAYVAALQPSLIGDWSPDGLFAVAAGGAGLAAGALLGGAGKLIGMAARDTGGRLAIVAGGHLAPLILVALVAALLRLHA